LPQRRFDLDPHEVGWIIEAASPARGGRAGPAPPDQGKYDLALSEGLVDVGAEVDTKGNRVDIEIDGIRAELARQAITKAPGDIR
jgi:hypothetical protein